MKLPRIGDNVNWFGDTNMNQTPVAAVVTDISGDVLTLTLFPPERAPISKLSVYHARSEYIKTRPTVIGQNGVWEWIDVVDEYQQELQRKEAERRQRLEKEREESLARQAEENKEKLLRKQVLERHTAGIDVTRITQALGIKKDVVEKIIAEYQQQFSVNMANSPQ